MEVGLQPAPLSPTLYLEALWRQRRSQDRDSSAWLGLRRVAAEGKLGRRWHRQEEQMGTFQDGPWLNSAL